ncbi:MAG: DUF4240 domain-containing protein [Agriterribacter sp.]
MYKYLSLAIFILIVTVCHQTLDAQQGTDEIHSLPKDKGMDTAFFWEVMDNAFVKGGFNNKVREQTILEQLVKLTPAQIQRFEIIFQQMNLKASTWGNFAAQTVMEGGSSDDRFYYFRCWLISLGKKNFEETIRNPDYLASLNIPVNKKYGVSYCQFEELIHMADNAYEIVTKRDPSSDTSFPRSHALKLGLFYDSNTEMSGVEWKEKELPKKIPLLCKKYTFK